MCRGSVTLTWDGRWCCDSSTPCVYRFSNRYKHISTSDSHPLVSIVRQGRWPSTVTLFRKNCNNFISTKVENNGNRWYDDMISVLLVSLLLVDKSAARKHMSHFCNAIPSVLGHLTTCLACHIDGRNSTVIWSTLYKQAFLYASSQPKATTPWQSYT